MKSKKIILFAAATLFVFCLTCYPENIDPNYDGSQYAYGENIGWLNFEPNEGPGVTVSFAKLTGYVWAENIGWINLDPNISDPNVGIKNDGTGWLSGYAWAENVGWIKFNPVVSGDPNDYGVKIDGDGNFDGFAWGENIGWINFGISDYYVVACKVTFEDLANFVDDWLATDPTSPANLISPDGVDGKDYAAFASRWRDFCPDGWLLK
jgi:hypothetical protein